MPRERICVLEGLRRWHEHTLGVHPPRSAEESERRSDEISSLAWAINLLERLVSKSEAKAAAGRTS
jgi:hypothetical protein